jgi:hypothetical protein
VRAGLGDQRQLGGDLQVGLELDLLAVGGDGRQPAQLGELLPFARVAGEGVARRG